MSRAFKCDRCGGFYEPQGYINDSFVICKSNLVKADICPICQVEFDAWFNKAKKLKEEKDGQQNG